MTPSMKKTVMMYGRNDELTVYVYKNISKPGNNNIILLL